VIFEYPRALSKEICLQLIKKIKSNNYSELIPSKSYLNDDCLEDPVIFSCVIDTIKISLSDYIHKTKFPVPMEGFSLRDISPVENSKGLAEHTDPSILFDGEKRMIRPLVFLVFLNDNYNGGHLLFPKSKDIILPSTGKLCIFPAHFSFPHTALPSDRPRYILRIELVVQERYWLIL